MARLPSLTARKVVRALKRAGFVEDRQKGSHLVLIRPDTKARTVVPIHVGRTIKAPLLRAIVRDANLSLDEFIEFALTSGRRSNSKCVQAGRWLGRTCALVSVLFSTTVLYWFQGPYVRR